MRMATEDTTKSVRGDIPAGRIALIGAGFAALVVTAVLVALGVMQGWRLPMMQPRPPTPDPDGPVQESSAQPALADYLARKQQQLDGVGWIDRAHGVAHIPIAMAMRMLAGSNAARATTTATSATSAASAASAGGSSDMGAAP
jgi:hypothetical protein